MPGDKRLGKEHACWPVSEPFHRYGLIRVRRLLVWGEGSRILLVLRRRKPLLSGDDMWTVRVFDDLSDSWKQLMSVPSAG